MSLCLCPGGDVHQPCGGKGEDPRGAETLAGGRLGPHHPTETGETPHNPKVQKVKRKHEHIRNSYHPAFSSSLCCLQLFHLPAKKNVEAVLEDYANYKKSKGNSDNK